MSIILDVELIADVAELSELLLDPLVEARNLGVAAKDHNV